MAHIITFMFKARAVLLAQIFQNARNIFECVAEDKIIGATQIGFFPIMLPIFVTISQTVQSKIHGSHVE